MWWRALIMWWRALIMWWRALIMPHRNKPQLSLPCASAAARVLLRQCCCASAAAPVLLRECCCAHVLLLRALISSHPSHAVALQLKDARGSVLLLSTHIHMVRSLP